MSDLDVFPMRDGCVQVSLSDGTHRVSCVVSSMHLVEDKRPQLRRALEVMQRELTELQQGLRDLEEQE